jgi:hypothetical protein
VIGRLEILSMTCCRVQPQEMACGYLDSNNFHHNLLNHRTDMTIEGIWTMLKEITLKQAFLYLLQIHYS